MTEYLRTITVHNESGGSTPSNLAVNFVLDTASLIAAGKMRSDCGDIRIFSDAALTAEVYHFIESGRGTAHCSVWFKTTHVLAAAGEWTYYLVYGNTDLTSDENPLSTVSAFEGFEGADLTGWTNIGTDGYTTQSTTQKVDGTKALRLADVSAAALGGRKSANNRFFANDKQTIVFWYRPVTDAAAGQAPILRINRPDGTCQFYMERDATNGFRGYDGSAFFSIATVAASPTGAWYRFRVKLDISGTPKYQKEIKVWDINLSQIGSTVANKTTYNYSPSGSTDFTFNSGNAGQPEVYLDQIFAYQYIDADPTLTLGGEASVIPTPTAVVTGSLEGVALGCDKYAGITVGVTDPATGPAYTGLKLFRASSSGGSYSEVTANTESGNPAANDFWILDYRPLYGTPSIPLGDTAYYKVKAVTARGDSDYSDAVSAVTDYDFAAIASAKKEILYGLLDAYAGDYAPSHAGSAGDEAYPGYWVQAMAYCYAFSSEAKFKTFCESEFNGIVGDQTADGFPCLGPTVYSYLTREFIGRTGRCAMQAAKLLLDAGETTLSATVRLRCDSWMGLLLGTYPQTQRTITSSISGSSRSHTGTHFAQECNKTVPHTVHIWGKIDVNQIGAIAAFAAQLYCDPLSAYYHSAPLLALIEDQLAFIMVLQFSDGRLAQTEDEDFDYSYHLYSLTSLAVIVRCMGTSFSETTIGGMTTLAALLSDALDYIEAAYTDPKLPCGPSPYTWGVQRAYGAFAAAGRTPLASTKLIYTHALNIAATDYMGAFSDTHATAPANDGEQRYFEALADVLAYPETVPSWSDLSLSINSGDATTIDPNVTLTIHADANGSDPDEMAFSDDDATWSEWEPYGTTKAYELPAGLGVKTVYVKFRAQPGVAWFESESTSDSIEVISGGPVWSGLSIVINAGAASTGDNAVALTIAAAADGNPPDEMCFSDDDVTWGAWEAYATSRDYQLPAQDDADPHVCTVYAKFRAGADESEAVSDSITLTVAWRASVWINGGAEVSASTEVELNIGAVSSAGTILYFRLRDGAGAWSAWQPYHGARKRGRMVVPYTFDGYGARSVTVQFRDEDLNTSPGASAAITILAPSVAPDVVAFDAGQLVIAGVLVYFGAQLVAILEAVDGAVEADARRTVWRTADVAFCPSDGWTHREIYDLLVTPGIEVVIRRGWVTVGGGELVVSLGRFIVDEATFAETEDGTEVTATFSDLSARISRARWTEPYKIDSGTGLVEALVTLLADRWPDVTLALDADVVANTIDAPVVFEAGDSSDPWSDAQNLAQAHGYTLFFDVEGVVRLMQPPDSASVAASYFYRRDEQAVVTSQTRVSPMEQTYNGVIATGEGSTLAVPVRGEAWDDDPQSPTYADGPFGRAPYFYSSPLIKTADNAEAVAASMLERVRGRVETLTWEQIPNPRIVPLEAVELEDDAGALHTYIIDQLSIPLAASEVQTAAARETRIAF